MEVKPTVQQAVALLKEGRVKEAGDMLKAIGKRLKEEREAVAFERVGLACLKEVERKAEEGLKGLEVALVNLRKVTSILQKVKEHLETVNASSRALEALDIAISSVEQVVEKVELTADEVVGTTVLLLIEGTDRTIKLETIPLYIEIEG